MPQIEELRPKGEMQDGRANALPPEDLEAKKTLLAVAAKDDLILSTAAQAPKRARHSGERWTLPGGQDARLTPLVSSFCRPYPCVVVKG